MIPEQAIAALARGEKVLAVKLTRERLGLDLKAAKEVVEAYEAGRTTVVDAFGPAGRVPMPNAAIAALEQGKKIEAVRIFRERNSVGLKDSKEAVEAYLVAHPALQMKYRQAGKAGRTLILLALAALAIAAVFELFVN